MESERDRAARQRAGHDRGDTMDVAFQLRRLRRGHGLIADGRLPDPCADRTGAAVEAPFIPHNRFGGSEQSEDGVIRRIA